MLQIKDIRKEYITGDLRQTALDGVSLNFRDSEFVAILGPSGSGKTTLLNIVGGLDRYDSGDLIINGISTKKYKDRDWDSYRNHTIGFVFQSYNLIPHQSVLANVELALTISGISRGERRRRAREALEQVGLGNQVHKRPNQMSGGQMQRVAIARALVNDPDILLADEPTGALDSDTSVQVMEMLARVAKDRLVIMVTHNPELAEAYANRIVRVRDGRIIDDSNPYEVKGAQPAHHENMGRSSMSVLTALGLSFNNLRTKKGRTLLTAFAGSIGIIGIALILSLSNGVNTYIDDIQRDAMLSYPIEIEEQSIDIASLMNRAQGAQEKILEERDTDAIYADNFEVERQAALRTTTNNLTAFKSYLDRADCELQQYVGDNGIVYSYDTKFDIYTYDPEDVFVNTDGSGLESTSPYAAMPAMMFGDTGNMQEILPGKNGELVSNAVKDKYTLLYGRYPEAYDEIMLVLNYNNTLSLLDLYEIGALPVSEYEELQDKLGGEEELDLDERKVSYAEVCKKTYYLIPQCDLYEENEDGTFSDISQNKKKIEALAQDAVELKITGVMKPNDDDDAMFFMSPIAYTRALTDYLIEYTDDSSIVRAQRRDPDTDLLTGLRFESSSKADKIDAARQYVKDMDEREKAALYQVLLMTGQVSEETATEPTEAEAVGTAFFAGTAAVQPLAVLPMDGEPTEPETAAESEAPSDAELVDMQLSLSVTRLPDRTVYYTGDAIDLSGGTVHERLTLTWSDGTSQVIENDAPMTGEGYSVDASLFDTARQGIYPVSVIKSYTDEASGRTVTGNTLLYVLVVQPSAPEPTQPAPTQPAPTDPPAPTQPPTAPAAPPEDLTPEQIEAYRQAAQGGAGSGLTQEQIASYLQAITQAASGNDAPSAGNDAPAAGGLTQEQIASYLQGLGTQSGTGVLPDVSQLSPEELASLYAAMNGASGTQGGTGLASGGSTQDMAALYAALQGGTGTSVPSQDLASMYAAMQGGTGTSVPSQDLASMYAAMQGGNTASTEGMDLSAFADLDLSNLSQEDLAALYAAQQGGMDGLELSPEDYEKLFSLSGKSEAELASLMDSYMEHPDDDVLLEIYDRYLASGNLEDNLKTFGVVDLDTPASISIYADSFESKDAIADCISAYNDDADEEDRITYTDYTALLMSSITTIINVISYVLIAFVGVSLVVSSIMIGIITYISVLERTKEIGILRAIGASKHNISQVFNAETFIIGLCSGLIGIGVTLLLLIPGNLIIHALIGSDTVNAALPVLDAAVLILLSVVLTLIGGFIPAKAAAKKDPVTALRTE